MLSRQPKPAPRLQVCSGYPQTVWREFGGRTAAKLSCTLRDRMVRTVVVALCLLVSACDGAPDEEDVRPALIEAIRGDLATVTLGLPGGRSLRPDDVTVANLEILNATDIGDAWSPARHLRFCRGRNAPSAAGGCPRARDRRRVGSLSDRPPALTSFNSLGRTARQNCRAASSSPEWSKNDDEPGVFDGFDVAVAEFLVKHAVAHRVALVRPLAVGDFPRCGIDRVHRPALRIGRRARQGERWLRRRRLARCRRSHRSGLRAVPRQSATAACSAIARGFAGSPRHSHRHACAPGSGRHRRAAALPPARRCRFSSKARWFGNRPSSHPGRKTWSNSRPLAAWRVISVRRSPASAVALSITSPTCFEEAGQGFEFTGAADELLQVFQPAFRFRRPIGLPHRRVAAFVQHAPRQVRQRQFVGLAAPSREVLEQTGQGRSRAGLQLIGFDQCGYRHGHRCPTGPRRHARSSAGLPHRCRGAAC